jgi:thiosulfate/3-mercaptopyruvate sulfurtransferase
MVNSNRITSFIAVMLGTFIVTLSLPGHAFTAAAKEPAVRMDMLVSTDWLAQRINEPAVVVLHVAKERKHYDAGHIPSARFVAWDELTATRDGVPNELPPVADLQKLFERLGVGDDARLILYGEMSGLYAARAYFTLDYLGHGDRAALLDGGIEKWRAEKRTIAVDAPAVKPHSFTIAMRPDVVVGLDVTRDLSWAGANLDKPQHVLVDARPEDEYTGVKPGEGVPRGGHIPGAANIFWMQHLVSKDNPVMRPVSELRPLYEAASAGPAGKVVTYCRTGGQASHAYFTAKYLGYDVAMYDGSFIEWSNASGTPVVKGTRRK